jgi:hypothetical protein
MMIKIANGIYKHKGRWIFTDNQGIFVENHMHLFKTYNDARLFIDKKHDGSHTKEPQIIGEWTSAE